MNLRILKKLSRRAAPLMIELGVRATLYGNLGNDDEPPCEFSVDEKHRWRLRAHASYLPNGIDRARVHGKTYRRTRKGGVVAILSTPNAAWRGTPTFGYMSGGMEPEWKEETAWHALVEHVFWAGEPIDARGEWKPLSGRQRRVRGNPAACLSAARALIIRAGACA